MNIGPGPFCGSTNRTTSSRTLCTCVTLHMVVKFYHPFPSRESCMFYNSSSVMHFLRRLEIVSPFFKQINIFCP